VAAGASATLRSRATRSARRFSSATCCAICAADSASGRDSLPAATAGRLTLPPWDMRSSRKTAEMVRLQVLEGDFGFGIF
jgi:hypothetical protein